MLGLPDRLDVRQPDGDVVTDQPMWTYWYLQEGEVAFDPKIVRHRRRQVSPVLHVDSDAPLHADDGTLITDEFWGVYFKPDRDSVQGGAQPLTVGPEFKVDPYPTGTVDPGFPGHVVGVAVALPRALRGRPRQVPPGPLGRRRRVHGRQLPGVRLHAPERVRRRRLQPRLQDDRRRTRDRPRCSSGEHSSLLHPFRYERFATGDLHPVSHSPYPWS